jgi:glutamate N-acetyltransferase/amino-acid N-acetyltransferase
MAKKKSGSIEYGPWGVAWPVGFQANGLYAEIKKNPVHDLGLLISEVPAVAAGVFTQNQMIAYPIVYSRDFLKKHRKATAILVNSGNANACTGTQGKKAVHASVEKLSRILKSHDILTFSTGRIGSALPIEKIISHLPELTQGLGRTGEHDVAFSKAILTTDTSVKRWGAEFVVGEKKVRIGCSAKGAGMIEPSMATMLCFITCDAQLPYTLLDKTLKKAVAATFNRISVDGDMSTNDSVVILCNGVSGVRIENEKAPGFAEFEGSLLKICQTISERIVADGEGATKLVRISVGKAQSEKDAKEVCASIANSLLLKCALFGESANWGRILSSIGATKAKINQKTLKVYLQGTLCYGNGEPNFNAESSLKENMRAKDILIEVALGSGTSSYSMLATDLSNKYVEINKH